MLVGQKTPQAEDLSDTRPVGVVGIAPVIWIIDLVFLVLLTYAVVGTADDSSPLFSPNRVHEG